MLCMLLSGAKIARPAKGRFYAASMTEVRRAVADAGMKPLDIVFRNPQGKSHVRFDVMALYVYKALVIFSLPEQISIDRGKFLLQTALQEFAAIDKDIEYDHRRK